MHFFVKKLITFAKKLNAWGVFVSSYIC